MTKPTSARLSDITAGQLAWLAERYGNQTTALTVAIDRLYIAHRREENTAEADSLGHAANATEQVE